MRHRIKSEQCLNCGLKYQSQYGRCLQYGQENTTICIFFLQPLRDLFDSHITLDLRFGRAIIPFLFRLGYRSAYSMKVKASAMYIRHGPVS
ncbi:hypothetical protein [Rhodoflexus sp.]